MTAYILKNKNVLVTGGAKRIGKALVHSLAEHKANVLIHYHTSEREARELQRDLETYGGEIRLFQGDLSDVQTCGELFDFAREQFGHIDVLINNASIFPKNTFSEISRKELIENIDINALAPYTLSQKLHEQGREASIINLLDTRIRDYDKQHVSYHLSKQMLHTLTRIMAVEYAPKIRVNAIAPGLILAPEGKDENYLEKLALTNPLETYGNPEDIARAMLFLLESPFITGQVVYVDGGRHLKGTMYD